MKVESKKEFPLSQNIKEIPLFSFVRKDKQTDRQTNRQTDKQTNILNRVVKTSRSASLGRIASRQKCLGRVI